MYNVLAIMRGTTVDGPGFRTSIYLAGCAHRCEGCHNPASWDKNGGSSMSLDEIMEIVRDEDFDVTLSGGDPLFNPESTARLVEALKNDGRNVWIYTGYNWEEILSDRSLLNAVEKADVLVDGPFLLHLKDADLLFRGSSNQRLILIQESLTSGNAVLFPRS
ncbi:MAG: anaerobic ribonucleoside-triphosphate reductase activating protein [Muribaculaceae bacterium]|nr:anaerobic ribonucleoside-triphosphate reductase activating protein [Muribaculaceae bacterium]